MENIIKKTVRYSSDTIFNNVKKKSNTTTDKQGNIIRPVIVNNIHYYRHDKLKYII
jgi:hypothetical protein